MNESKDCLKILLKYSRGITIRIPKAILNSDEGQNVLEKLKKDENLKVATYDYPDYTIEISIKWNTEENETLTTISSIKKHLDKIYSNRLNQESQGVIQSLNSYLDMEEKKAIKELPQVANEYLEL